MYAYIYNGDKESTWWIQVDYKGNNYIPFAWLNFSSNPVADAATLTALAEC